MWCNRRKKPKKSLNILVLGPKGSGKTTVCLRLTGSKTPVPSCHEETKGACRGPFTGYPAGSSFKLTELGGEMPSFHLPSFIYARTHAIIFVFDPTVAAQVEEARGTLESLMTIEFLRGKPFLIFGNKVDRLTKGERKKLKKTFQQSLNLRTLAKSTKTKTKTFLISALSLKKKSHLLPAARGLLKELNSNCGNLKERTRLERERNREAEVKHDLELLRRASEEDAKLKVAVKKSLPSSPWGTREVAPIVIVSC
jgi:GTPase SAR1 family protein